MNKGVLVLSVVLISSFDLCTPVRAAELRYQCVDNEGRFPIIIDTNTKSVLFGEPNLEHGRAVITGSSISITLDSDPSYRGRIDRKTGKLSDSEGGGTCTLVK